MDFRTLFLFFSVLFVAWWMGGVMKADGEEQYIEACMPVTLTTKYLMKFSTALTGFTPNWTIEVKRVLDGGCYYFFASMMANQNLGEGTELSVIQETREGGSIQQ